MISPMNTGWVLLEDVQEAKGMQHIHHIENTDHDVTRDYYLASDGMGYVVFMRLQMSNEILWYQGDLVPLSAALTMELELHREESL